MRDTGGHREEVSDGHERTRAVDGVLNPNLEPWLGCYDIGKHLVPAALDQL